MVETLIFRLHGIGAIIVGACLNPGKKGKRMESAGFVVRRTFYRCKKLKDQKIVVKRRDGVTEKELEWVEVVIVSALDVISGYLINREFHAAACFVPIAKYAW